MVCEDANKVCNWSIWFGCKVVKELPILEKGIQGTEDPDACGIGIVKEIEGWQELLVQVE